VYRDTCGPPTGCVYTPVQCYSGSDCVMLALWLPAVPPQDVSILLKIAMIRMNALKILAILKLVVNTLTLIATIIMPVLLIVATPALDVFTPKLYAMWQRVH